MMIPEEFKELPELMKRLRELDSEFRVFGAYEHQYKLHPPVSEKTLVAFEKQYGIILPADFRNFYRYVSNGGAGPFYGLYSLQKSITELEEYVGHQLNTKEPFTWTKKTNIFEDRPELKERHEFPGVILLAEQGCGDFSFLVVNGPAYGTIWTGSVDRAGDFWPSKLTFTRWYIKWMNYLRNKAVPVMENEQILKHIKLGMTKAEVISICGANWCEEISVLASVSDEKIVLRFPRLATKFAFDSENVLVRFIRLSP
jgi:hypothetical protein